MSLIQKTIAAGLAFAAGAVLVACGGGKSSSSSAAAGSSPAAGGSPAAVASPAASTGAMTGAGGMKGASGAMTAHAVTVKMMALNGSKQDGTATITPMGTGVAVMVKLNNEPAAASEPSHIHEGPCAKLNPAPWKPLKSVVGGTATTTVAGVTIAELTKGHYAINVHKSLNDLKTYVSCGDITK